MSKFKVGDRIRVVHNFAEGSDYALGGTGHVVAVLSVPNIWTGYYPGVFFKLEGKEYPPGGLPGDLALDAELALKP